MKEKRYTVKVLVSASALARQIRQVFLLHHKIAKRPGKRFRGWKDPRELRTPYGIHPVWAAMTILHERALPPELRWNGAQALLYHDILEDTTASLPQNLPEHIQELIRGMTFEDFQREENLVWERSPEVRLLILYEKTSNWLDGDWLYPERRAIHREHLAKLADDVEKHWGNLNIVVIARALISGKV